MLVKIIFNQYMKVVVVFVVLVVVVLVVVMLVVVFVTLTGAIVFLIQSPSESKYIYFFIDYNQFKILFFNTCGTRETDQ